METKTYKFSELLSNVVDNRGRTCPVEETGIPLIATNCISNDHLYPTYEKVRYVNQETYDTWFRGHPKPGDILFVNKGTPGRVCMVPDPVEFCIAQDMVAIRANESIVLPKFLFALLRSGKVQHQIQNMHVGTLIPHFKKGDFQNLYLEIPNFDIQSKIGDMYFNYSHKIELNRRMNRTLEEMARALFKCWFVDFEPVRMKAEGRDPSKPVSEGGLGLDPEIAALFPDSFEDSELGEIPKGWEVKPLDEIADFLNGLAMQKHPPLGNSDDVPVIKIAQLRSMDLSNASMAAPTFKEEYLVQDGDLLFSWSGSLMATYWSAGPGALNQHLFKVTSKEYPLSIIYHWIDYHLPWFQTIASSKATTMGHIQRKHLGEVNVVIPIANSFRVICDLIDNLHTKIINNNLESANLSHVRNHLLSHLIFSPIKEY